MSEREKISQHLFRFPVNPESRFTRNRAVTAPTTAATLLLFFDNWLLHSRYVKEDNILVSKIAKATFTRSKKNHNQQMLTEITPPVFVYSKWEMHGQIIRKVYWYWSKSDISMDIKTEKTSQRMTLI